MGEAKNEQKQKQIFIGIILVFYLYIEIDFLRRDMSMDMSKSSEYRIKEMVNIVKITSDSKTSNDLRHLIQNSLITKVKNPNMLFTMEDDNEALFVPHMLTHQEYVYMMEHLEELMDGESSPVPVPVPVPGPDDGK